MAKREVVRKLERIRSDTLVGMTVECWSYEGELEKITGCDMCSGAGVIAPEGGLYNMAVVGGAMGAVLDLVRELMPETADPDLKAAVRWMSNYRTEAAVYFLAQSDNLDMVMEMADRYAKLQGERSEYLDLLYGRLKP
ncbi:hypothetical protein LCGC14_2370940, partial [marine sediment metagenome]